MFGGVRLVKARGAAQVKGRGTKLWITLLTEKFMLESAAKNNKGVPEDITVKIGNKISENQTKMQISH